MPRIFAVEHDLFFDRSARRRIVRLANPAFGSSIAARIADSDGCVHAGHAAFEARHVDAPRALEGVSAVIVEASESVDFGAHHEGQGASEPLARFRRAQPAFATFL